MTKENKLYLGIGTVLAIGGALFIYDRMKKSKEAPMLGSKLNEDVYVDSSVFPLEKGAKGQEVLTVQKFLNLSERCKEKAAPKPNERAMPLYPLEEDGIFGDKTEAILQRCYGTSSINESTYLNMKKGVEKMTIKA